MGVIKQQTQLGGPMLLQIQPWPSLTPGPWGFMGAVRVENLVDPRCSHLQGASPKRLGSDWGLSDLSMFTNVYHLVN